jgi:hypothetical protein
MEYVDWTGDNSDINIPTGIGTQPEDWRISEYTIRHRHTALLFNSKFDCGHLRQPSNIACGDTSVAQGQAFRNLNPRLRYALQRLLTIFDDPSLE